MNLTDVDIILGNDVDDGGHREIAVKSGVYQLELDDPTYDDDTVIAATHHMAGLLARLVVHLADDLEIEQTIHGCPRRIYVAFARDRAERANGPTSRILTAGSDHVQPDEIAMHYSGDEACSSFLIAGPNPEAAAYFYVPDKRHKHWLKLIQTALQGLHA